MRRIRPPAAAARQVPRACQHVAVDRPAAGVPAAVAAVVVVLVALACPANTPTRPAAAGSPLESVVGGSLAAFQLAVLPARDLAGGVVTVDRPNPAPIAADMHTAGRPTASQSARRPGHDAAGEPRAPPSPHLS